MRKGRKLTPSAPGCSLLARSVISPWSSPNAFRACSGRDWEACGLRVVECLASYPRRLLPVLMTGMDSVRLGTLVLKWLILRG